MPGCPAGCAPSRDGIDLLMESAGPGRAPGRDPPSGGAAANLAMEEALVRAGPVRPLLRVWRSSQCVVVGRGQRVDREVDLAACSRDGVPVLRRASGGGTVYHDLGNLNISIAVPGYVPGLGGDLMSLVAEAVERLGLTPSIGERGVFIGGLKVSGLAAQLTRGGSLAHATLLVTTPAALVCRFLAPAPSDRRPLDSLRVPVGALRDHNPSLTVASATSAVLGAAASRFGGLLTRAPRAAERRWLERLLAERYTNPAWHMTGRQTRRRHG